MRSSDHARSILGRHPKAASDRRLKTGQLDLRWDIDCAATLIASPADKDAGIEIRPPRGRRLAKPASQTSTDSAVTSKAASWVSTDTGSASKPGRSPQASACEPYRELIEAAVAKGRDAMAIWQDLVDDHGFSYQYASVQRFVRRLREGTGALEAHPVILTAPGEEGQVDYGTGAIVRPAPGAKYQRTRPA